MRARAPAYGGTRGIPRVHTKKERNPNTYTLLRRGTQKCRGHYPATITPTSATRVPTEILKRQNPSKPLISVTKKYYRDKLRKNESKTEN